MHGKHLNERMADPSYLKATKASIDKRQVTFSAGAEDHHDGRLTTSTPRRRVDTPVRSTPVSRTPVRNTPTSNRGSTPYARGGSTLGAGQNTPVARGGNTPVARGGSTPHARGGSTSGAGRSTPRARGGNTPGEHRGNTPFATREELAESRAEMARMALALRVLQERFNLPTQAAPVLSVAPTATEPDAESVAIAPFAIEQAATTPLLTCGERILAAEAAAVQAQIVDRRKAIAKKRTQLKAQKVAIDNCTQLSEDLKQKVQQEQELASRLKSQIKVVQEQIAEADGAA